MLDNITDVMERKLAAKDVEEHHNAAVRFMHQEFCYDLAKRHTDARFPLKKPSETRKRHKNIDKLVRLRSQTRSEARMRYQEIAQDLYCLRPKPPSARRATSQERLEAAGKIESGQRKRLIVAMTAAPPPDFWMHPDGRPKTTANRLLRDWKRRGKRGFFNHLSDVIRRYLFAREKARRGLFRFHWYRRSHSNGCAMRRRSGASWKRASVAGAKSPVTPKAHSAGKQWNNKSRRSPGRDTKTIQTHLQKNRVSPKGR
jgi:hypothetical protein